MPAALRVRFLRTACPACWLLDVSRLIASRMVFRAQGESPASCARELGLNPAAPMLPCETARGLQQLETHSEDKHLLNQKPTKHWPPEPAPASAPGPASASEHHLRAATTYGRMLPKRRKRVGQHITYRRGHQPEVNKMTASAWSSRPWRVGHSMVHVHCSSG